jgi:hypothetical protein
MASNQFIARRGIIALDDAQVTGSLSVTGNISASIFSGSFVGNGSQLTGVSAGFPFTGSAEVTGSLTVTGSVSATTFFGNGSQLTGIEGFPFTGSARITGSLVVVGPVNATSFTGSLQGIATSASYIQLTNVDGFTAYSASINTTITPQTATVNTGSSPLTLTTQSIVVADSTNGNLIINLPDLNTVVGTSNQKPIVVYKNDYSQNVIYVNPSGSQLVNGASQDIIVSIQLAVIYNPTSAGWVTEGTSAQSLAELELFFLSLTETGSLATTGSNVFIGNQIVTGSLTVTGGINATITGSVTSASYVEYVNVANKPTLVSGSAQVTYSGLTGVPSGIVSGSSQVTYSGLTGVPAGIVSSSAQITGYNIFATTSSNQFNGSQAITGSLTVTGQVVAQTLNVQQVTSSIVYSSGSNIFGNSLGNTQQFTGSVSVTGSLAVAGALSGTSGTLTGALSGTSATFSGNLNLQGAVTRNINFYDSSNTNINAQIQYDQISSTSGQLFFGTNNAGTFATRLTLSNTGAATFSSTLSAKNSTFANGSALSEVTIGQTSTGYSSLKFAIDATKYSWLLGAQYNVDNGFEITPSTVVGGSTFSSPVFKITNTGAATFSSSVQTGGDISLMNASGDISLRMKDSGGNADRVLLRQGTTNNVYLGDIDANGGKAIIRANGEDYLTILSTGNVGIGTASPDRQLEVSSSSGATIRLKRDDTSVTDNEILGTLEFFTNDGDGPHVASYVRGLGADLSGQNFGRFGALAFGVSKTANTDAVEAMRIDLAGNVGIGTDTPSFILDVQQAQVITRLLSTTGTNSASTRWSNTGGSLYVGIEQSATGALLTGDSAYAGVIARTGAYPLQFGTNDVLRMTITSGGALCIGTDALFLGSQSKLQIIGPDAGPTFKNETSAQQSLFLWNSATSGNNLFIEFGTEGAGSLAVRGSIDYNRAAGLVRYNTTSDVNLKNIIGDSDKTKSIGILNSTKIREYSWKDDESNKVQIGVIAQELYETYKGAVSVGSSDELLGTEDYKPWRVDKTAFTFHLIAGFQEHEKIIKELQSQIESLKAEIQTLKQ